MQNGDVRGVPVRLRGCRTTRSSSMIADGARRVKYAVHDLHDPLGAAGSVAGINSVAVRAGGRTVWPTRAWPIDWCPVPVSQHKDERHETQRSCAAVVPRGAKARCFRVLGADLHLRDEAAVVAPVEFLSGLDRQVGRSVRGSLQQRRGRARSNTSRGPRTRRAPLVQSSARRAPRGSRTPHRGQWVTRAPGPGLVLPAVFSPGKRRAPARGGARRTHPPSGARRPRGPRTAPRDGAEAPAASPERGQDAPDRRPPRPRRPPLLRPPA